MSNLELFVVNTPTLLEEFIKFPMELYKNNPYFVPAMQKEEFENWDPSKNTILQKFPYKLLILKRNQQIVGRMALMINRDEELTLGIKKVRFGWIDFIDDVEVSKRLFEEAKRFATEHDIDVLEGPMGFTNLDKAGMLTMGFDKVATMIGIYNYDYYPKHLLDLGFVQEKEWVEFEIDFPKVLPEKVERFSKLLTEKYELKCLDFPNKQVIMDYADAMFDLLDLTYQNLSTYTPLSPEQRENYKLKYFPFIEKDYIVCVVDKEYKLVAFAITMPSYSEAMQKSKGKFLPFGWWYFMKAIRRNTRANFYLIGVLPEYQKRGITAIIFKEIHRKFSKKGVRFLETNPELEENKNVQLLWQDYHPVNHKRRKTFRLQF